MRDLRHEQAAAAQDLFDWLVFLDLQGKRPRTLYGYTREMAPLLRAYPELAFSEFTHNHINEQLRLKPARSRHQTRSIYSGWFTWGVMDGRLDHNPMLKVPQMKAPHQRPKDIFEREEIALLEALPSPDGQLWTILFKTGLRRGEARHLNRAHIDLNRARLVVHNGKGGKDRVVPMPPDALAAVSDLDLLERVGRDDYLWYTKPGGGPRRHRTAPIADTTYERWYKQGITDADVRYLNPHQTRHTYGWWLRGEGFDIEERQLLMGHESIATTEHYYGRMSIDDVAAKVALL
jgi:integrase